jgi:hypothetical protein
MSKNMENDTIKEFQNLQKKLNPFNETIHKLGLKIFYQNDILFTIVGYKIMKKKRKKRR